MKRLTTLKAIRLADTGAEEVRRNHHDAIGELQLLADRDVVSGVSLANGTATRVPHRLGRAPDIVTISVPRGATAAGYIVETRTGIDTSKAIMLTASGYGATITVDVEVK